MAITVAMRAVDAKVRIRLMWCCAFLSCHVIYKLISLSTIPMYSCWSVLVRVFRYEKPYISNHFWVVACWPSGFMLSRTSHRNAEFILPVVLSGQVCCQRRNGAI